MAGVPSLKLWIMRFEVCWGFHIVVTVDSHLQGLVFFVFDNRDSFHTRWVRRRRVIDILRLITGKLVFLVPASIAIVMQKDDLEWVSPRRCRIRPLGPKDVSLPSWVKRAKSPCLPPCCFSDPCSSCGNCSPPTESVRFLITSTLSNSLEEPLAWFGFEFLRLPPFPSSFQFALFSPPIQYAEPFPPPVELYPLRISPDALLVPPVAPHPPPALPPSPRRLLTPYPLTLYPLTRYPLTRYPSTSTLSFSV